MKVFFMDINRKVKNKTVTAVGSPGQGVTAQGVTGQQEKVYLT